MDNRKDQRRAFGRPVGSTGIERTVRTVGVPGAWQSEFGTRADASSGFYVISVVARILDMHPQTLRKYERLGMVTPSRTMGMLRLYSELDIAQLRLIKHLVTNVGLNMAGVRLALNMFNRLISMKRQIRGLEPSRVRASLDEGVSRMIELLEQGSV
jgi:MerR family transcriptional regulator/heat shock protein HspR